MTDAGRRFPDGGAGGDADLEGTAAAYALGALPPDEARAFEALLAGRPDLRALVDDWAPAVAALHLAADEAEPSARLKRRLMAAVADGDARGGAGGPAASPIPFPRRPVSDGQPEPAAATATALSGRRRPGLSFVLPLAAMLLLSLGLAYGWARAVYDVNQAQGELAKTRGELRESLGQLARIQTQASQISNRSDRLAQLLRATASGRTSQLVARDVAPGAKGFVIMPEDGEPALVADGLPPLGPNQVYQAWAVPASGAAPVPGSVFRAGEPFTTVGASLAGARAVAITIENNPNGSQTPTLPVIASAAINES